jgi:hypothetical protein
VTPQVVYELVVGDRSDVSEAGLTVPDLALPSSRNQGQHHLLNQIGPRIPEIVRAPPHQESREKSADLEACGRLAFEHTVDDLRPVLRPLIAPLHRARF